MLLIITVQRIGDLKVRAQIFILFVVVKRSLQRALNPASYDDTNEIGVTIDAVDGRVGIEIDNGNILNDHLPRLWVVPAMDEKALVFIPEIIAEYAIYPVAFLFDDQFGQIVIVQTGHLHVGATKPGSGSGLRAQAMCGQQAKYN